MKKKKLLQTLKKVQKYCYNRGCSNCKIKDICEHCFICSPLSGFNVPSCLDSDTKERS